MEISLDEIRAWLRGESHANKKKREIGFFDGVQLHFHFHIDPIIRAPQEREKDE